MISVTSLAVFVGKNIAGYAIKRGLDNQLKDRQTFENRLAKVIDETIEEYDKTYTIAADNKFPFFKINHFYNIYEIIELFLYLL